MNSAVVPRVYAEDSGEMTPIGTAFAIACGGREAILVSARHVFQHAGYLDGERDRIRHHATALSEFLPPRSAYVFEKGKVYAVMLGQENSVHFATVGTVMHHTNTDLVWFSAFFSEPTPKGIGFAGKLSVDTDQPDVGDEVFALGFPNMTSSWEADLERGAFSVQLVCRRAVVLETFSNGYAPMRLGPSIRIDAPISCGMSGGPVVQKVAGR